MHESDVFKEADTFQCTLFATNGTFFYDVATFYSPWSSELQFLDSRAAFLLNLQTKLRPT